jgi:hypothetical protein
MGEPSHNLVDVSAEAADFGFTLGVHRPSPEKAARSNNLRPALQGVPK